MAKYLSLLLVAAVALSRFEVDAATGEGVHEDVVEEEDASTNSSPFDLGEVVFVVLAPIQNSKGHTQSWLYDDDVLCKRARKMKERWEEQISQLTEKEPQVLFTREEWAPRGSWTILATLSVLKDMYFELSTSVPVKWFMFVTEETEINFTNLELILRRFDPSEDVFLGHGIQDSSPTIIHHYAFTTGKEVLTYPVLQAGMALSAPLLKRLAGIAKKVDINFNIDPPFEFALVAKYLTKKLLDTAIKPVEKHPEGVLLTHVPEFCVSDRLEGNCVTAFSMNINDCDYPGIVKVEDVLFAVKTHAGNHEERLPFIHKTWGPDAGDSLMLFSDQEDPKYGTVYQGVPNAKKGHCDQTLAIIKRSHTDEKLRKKDWIVISDDDSFFSVPRLMRYLSCYDPSESLLLGEAYGFFAHKADGYSYVTGGGGIILSRGAVSLFIDRDIKCPAPDHPDDMFIGHIAHYYNLNVVFTSLFHQDQPQSYPAELLKLQEPISFHRHHPTHPYEFYDTYLGSGRTRRRICKHRKKKGRSALLNMMEDEDLRKLLPPGFDDKLKEYEELQERLNQYQKKSDDVGWDDDEEEEGEGECYYDDEEFQEHKSFYTKSGSRNHEGEGSDEGHTHLHNDDHKMDGHTHQHTEL